MNTKKTIPTSARDLARICCPADEGAFATLCADMGDLPAAALAAYWEAAAHEDPTGEEPGFWGLGRAEQERHEVAAQRAALHARAEQLGVLAGAAPPGHLRVLADRLGAAAHDRALALLVEASFASALAGSLTLLRDLHAELPAVLGRADEQFRARALGAEAIACWRIEPIDPWAGLAHRAEFLSYLSDEWISDAREHLGGRDDDAVLYRAYLLGAGAPADVIAETAPALRDPAHELAWSLGAEAARQRVGLRVTIVDYEQAWRWLSDAWSSDAAEHLDGRVDDRELYRAYCLGAGAPLDVLPCPACSTPGHCGLDCDYGKRSAPDHEREQHRREDVGR